MDNINEILLDEQQHRLLQCVRMARIMGLGEVILDITTHRILYVIEKNDCRHYEFDSLDAIEAFLEETFEKRRCFNMMSKPILLRKEVMDARKLSADSGGTIFLNSHV